MKRAQLQAIRRNFETLQMKDSKLVANYCKKAKEIANNKWFYSKVKEDTTIVFTAIIF